VAAAVDDPTTDSPPQGQNELDAEAQARAVSSVGRVISERYRVDDLLAMGGMGAVYRGTHLLLKKRIAIKILHPGIENLPELVTRFEREAIAGAHVQHPNVAAATDFGTLEDGSYFLVLEYVKGRTIHQAIKRSGAFPAARAAKIARQIASALGAAHAIGILHRDVKPRNIMLVEGQDDVAKLIDFGLARVPVEAISAAADRLSRVSLLGRGSALSVRNPSAGDRLTVEGMIFGTIAYLAPEAALGMDAVDERSDLYALGIVLYEMLAGKHPFEAIDATELFEQQRFAKPPPIAERAPGVKAPAALEAVVMRLLDKAPDLRYPSGAAVVAAIDAAMAAPTIIEAEDTDPVSEKAAPSTLLTPSPPSKPYTPLLRPVPAGRGDRRRVIGGGVLFFAIGVGGMLLFAHARAPARGQGPEAVTTASAVVPLRASASAGAVVGSAPSASASASAFTTTTTTTTTSTSTSASASASAAVLAPVDSLALRITLTKSARLRDWGRGGDALVALIDADPEALRKNEVAVAARDVTAALERESGAEKLYAALAKGPNDAGLDVLYDIVQSKGGSHAAERASEILKQDAVLLRATPALRIAFRLRDASCVDKIPLFDVAAKEGDGRALVVMETQGRACFKKSKELDFAIKELKDRLIRGALPR
jgi:eukaryotic-like serine/threonine-protein kinase